MTSTTFAWPCAVLLILMAPAILGVPAKRAPFSSWAGKRSLPMQHQQHHHYLDRQELRRLIEELQELQDYDLINGADEEQELYPNEVLAVSKKAPFSSWAGKRAPFSSWAGKRAPFSSWAGRRRRDTEEQIKQMEQEGQRQKRSLGDDDHEALDENELDNELENLRVRRGANSFSAWGGKRSGQLRRFTRNAPESGLVSLRVLRPQRAAFSAWGG